MYTHGLEKIYAFETINPKSVKTVSHKPKDAPTEAAPAPNLYVCEQLVLDFGPYYQEGLPSFRLKEPIASLGLSAFAAKMLVSKEVFTVEEAYHFVSTSPKGVGQNHVEEIQAKIEAFVGKNPFGRQKNVDWQSLLRIICKDLGAKERYCLFARFGLEKLSNISAAEFQEIQRLSKEQINKLIDQAIALIKVDFIDTALSTIAEAYILPWLKYRHGFAQEGEVYERLIQTAANFEHFWQILRVLTLFGPPLKLDAVEKGVYVADKATRRDYILVVECARSYFYQPFATYPLATLIRLITKELSIKGHGFKEGFIEKTLTTTPSLQVSPSGNVNTVEV